MLFDSKADKVLWLILVNDRKNRNKIIECINAIPVYVREQIVRLFQEYNSGASSVGISGVVGLFKGSLDYSVLISDGLFKLRLFKSVSNENLLQEIYELSLMLFSDDIYQKGIAYQIGEFKNEKRFVNNQGVFQVEETVNKYSLRNSSFGVMISRDDSVIPIRINLDSLPDDVNILDFSNKRSINTLVRRRNRGSKY